MARATGCRLVTVSSLLVVLSAGAPIVDAAERNGGSVARAAKRKALSCRGAKVPVIVGKRKTCRPIAKVLPKPKAVDLRLAYLRQVLRFDPAKAAHGGKRKRARTLQSGFGAAGRRAQRKLLRLLPKALALVDRKRSRGDARSSTTRVSHGPPAAPDVISRPAIASSGCDAGYPLGTGHVGGATVAVLGDNGMYIDAEAGGGLRVRVTFVDCRGTAFHHVPECPTASGSVDAEGEGQFRATIEVWDDETLVSRNSSTFEDRSRAHGEVGADAKLKFIDVEHTQEALIIASGGIVIRGGVTRRARIAMPGGSYDPAGASVRYFGDKISDQSGAAVFANTAAAAIGAYRTAESRWSSFDSGVHCAEAVSSPESNTLKLRKNDSKQLSVYARARADGGRASEARWTLLGPENAEFSPTTSGAAAPTISYRVTNAPLNGFVKVSVRFTSTAGVGEGSWTQPTEQAAVNHIDGTFTYHFEWLGSVLEWTGEASFDRLSPPVQGGAEGAFNLAGGRFTVTASGSGAWPLGAPLCSQSGSENFLLDQSSQFTVIGSGPELTGPPYEYSFGIASSIQPVPMFTITIFDCAPQAAEQAGSYEYPASLGMYTTTPQTSADGLDYSGSETFGEGGASTTQTWSFRGTE
jgi:hypothetical protein